MRKNLNRERIEGYVFEHTLEEKTSQKGVQYIGGEIKVAVDEAGLNVLPVHFTYVTEVFGKSGKKNATYDVLKTIIANESKTWVAGGKDNAFKVRIDTSLDVNDFYNQQDELISAKRNEGGFVSFVNELADETVRNTFELDMLINRVTHVDADPDRNIDADFVRLGGYVFNFRNDILPVELVCKSAGGMNYFEDAGVTEANPLYTKVQGRINNVITHVTREEESAWGEPIVKTYERSNKEWLVTIAAKVPYEVGLPETITVDDMKVAKQNREVKLADIKKRRDEWLASSNTPAAAPATAAVQSGGFNF